MFLFSSFLQDDGARVACAGAVAGHGERYGELNDRFVFVCFFFIFLLLFFVQVFFCFDILIVIIMMIMIIVVVTNIISA